MELESNVEYQEYKPYFDRELEIINKAKEVFNRFGEVEKIYSKLNKKEKGKFLKICHFYYYRCCRFKTLDTGMILVAVTSSIEALISEVKYKSFIEWYSSECEDKDSSVPELWDSYIKIYGAAKKFVCFWENFASNEDKKNFREKSWVMSPKIENQKKKYKKEDWTIQDASKVLYKLRSLFVHNAEELPISNHDESDGTTFLGSGFSIGDKHYFFGMTMDKFVPMFERGFIKYFEKVIK